MVIQSVFDHVKGMRFDLGKMESRGSVDPKFTRKIDALNSELDKMKQYWTNQKETSVKSAFIFYSAMHNSMLVLGRMKERFQTAKETGDNPGIACDSLLVMPIISEVYQKTVQAAEEKHKLNTFLPDKTLELVSALRTTAKLVSLLPTPDQEVGRIDKTRLRETAVEIDKKFVASNLLNAV